ncbi:MAG: hypothetical protein IIT97_00720, partial [Mycoplasmataceae bacterium]|nr:hypothetical protein [Mycoplasmataceae bacterium]
RIQEEHIERTILNSIRCVVETIIKFQNPMNKELCKNQLLKSIWSNKSNEICKIINDGSHGSITGDKLYPNEIIIKACQELILFMQKDQFLKGQIEYVEKYLKNKK